MADANTAYRYRLYPTKEQELLFHKTFGCCRKVWNLMLADKISHYRMTGGMLPTTPAMYKDAYPFLREVDSLALANVQMHLQAAYKNFFRNRRTGFPKYKSRKHSRASYTTNLVGGNIAVLDGGIRLPKAGCVPAVIHRRAPGGYRLKSVTVSMERDGSYYASVLYAYEKKEHPAVDPATASHIGLDYQSDGLYMDSNKISCGMPHFYREAEKRLARAQHRLSRKQKGSRNREKQARRVAKLSRHVSNQRRDFLHKRSAGITNQYDIISVEDLDMKAMSQSLRLGKSTLDNGYGMFVQMLAYKQARLGHVLVKVGKFFPSSQLCHCCGYQNSVTKDLSVRQVTCPICNAEYDRDWNAACNIDREGIRLLMG